ncbi:magnesium transporter [Flavobacteriaceae bacterium]|nr:magnesium transporter [Flavobacteriaceae bacterium]MDB2631767.1 magnesium transporter [Flavobacteriaceae bacterium]
METSKAHIPFENTPALLEGIKLGIKNRNDVQLLDQLNELHYADIAEILDDLNLEQATYIIKLLDSETTSDILAELEDDVREKVLQNLSEKEIAEEVKALDTDDAADLLSELPLDRKQKVIAQIDDKDLVADINELLEYDENTAGGLMAKELVKVYETWTVAGCLRKIRLQAKNVKRVHSIYVVTKDEKLIGRLSLKDLLIAKNETKISAIYIPKVDSVHVNDDDEDVARLMAKYDLEAVPVVDDQKTLLGRITIDDIVDVIKEEAEKDYQLAAGITQDVNAEDSIFALTKARLPWLFLGLIGGVSAAIIMGTFDTIIEDYPLILLFTPLIAAMAGNVGVQSSAIIVQGLANDDIKGSINNRLLKEMLLATLNGIILALFLFAFVWVWQQDIQTALSVSVSLVAVIIVAGIVGTFVPLFLHKRGIDPAIATGPFITTSNDIFGILIYFIIAKFILNI